MIFWQYIYRLILSINISIIQVILHPNWVLGGKGSLKLKCTSGCFQRNNEYIVEAYTINLMENLM